jgi:hypothetical protein
MVSLLNPGTEIRPRSFGLPIRSGGAEFFTNDVSNAKDSVRADTFLSRAESCDNCYRETSSSLLSSCVCGWGHDDSMPFTDRSLTR